MQRVLILLLTVVPALARIETCPRGHFCPVKTRNSEVDMYKCPSPAYQDIGGDVTCKRCQDHQVATDNGHGCRECNSKEQMVNVKRHCGRTLDDVNFVCLSEPDLLDSDGEVITRAHLTELINGYNEFVCPDFMIEFDHAKRKYLQPCFTINGVTPSTWWSTNQEDFDYEITYLVPHELIIVKDGNYYSEVMYMYNRSIDYVSVVPHAPPALDAYPNESYKMSLTVVPDELEAVLDFPHARDDVLPFRSSLNVSAEPFSYRGYYPLYLDNDGDALACEWNHAPVDSVNFDLPDGAFPTMLCTMQGGRALQGFRNGSRHIIQFGTHDNPFWAFLDRSSPNVALGDYCESDSDCTGCIYNRCPKAMIDQVNNVMPTIHYPFYSWKLPYDVAPGLYLEHTTITLDGRDFYYGSADLASSVGVPFIGVNTGDYCENDDACALGKCVNYECPMIVNGWFPVYKGSEVGNEINPRSYTHPFIYNYYDVSVIGDRFYSPGVEMFDACLDTKGCGDDYVCSDNRCVSMFDSYLKRKYGGGEVEYVIPLEQPYLAIQTYQERVCDPCRDGFEKVDDVCVQCQPGKFSNPDTGNICDDCPAGFFSDSFGAVLCTKCDKGSISASGAAECDTCTPGKYENGGRTACEDCDFGTYQDAFGATVCKNCGNDTWVDYEGAYSAFECASCVSSIKHEGWSSDVGCFLCTTDINTRASEYVKIGDYIVGIPTSRSRKTVTNGTIVQTFSGYGAMKGQCIPWSVGTYHHADAQHIDMRDEDFTRYNLTFHSNIVIHEDNWVNSFGKPYRYELSTIYINKKFRIASTGHMIGPNMRVPNNLTHDDVKGMEANFINPEAVNHLIHGQPKSCSVYTLNDGCETLRNIPEGRSPEYYKQLYEEFGGDADTL